MKKRPTIRFSIDPEQKEFIDHYAKVKGFDNASNLARMALFNYMARNRVNSKTKRHSATACTSEGIVE